MDSQILTRFSIRLRMLVFAGAGGFAFLLALSVLLFPPSAHAQDSPVAPTISVSSITTTATVTAPAGCDTENVVLEYRVAGSQEAWTSITSGACSNVAGNHALTGLTVNTGDTVRATTTLAGSVSSLSSQTLFTTLAETMEAVTSIAVNNIGLTTATVMEAVTSIAVNNIGLTTATVTVAINQVSGTAQTCVRYRIEGSSDAWNYLQKQSSVYTLTFDLTGLTSATSYEVASAQDRLTGYNCGSQTGWTQQSLGSGESTTFRTLGLFFGDDASARNLANNTLADGNVGLPVTATGGTAPITYALSGTDAASFSINSTTGQITLGQSVTIRALGQTYTVIVTATDSASSTVNVTVTITVAGPNTAPTFASASVSRSVPENSGVGTNVGEPVTATDPNDDTLTYTLSGADAAKYDIGSPSGQITVAADTDLDYETDPSDSVTVTATDPFGAVATASVSISITDVNVAGDLAAPPNVQVIRSADNMSVTVSWASPEESPDSYIVQRQELVVQPSSSFFANTLTVATGVTGVSYVDDQILSGRTYEYRVSAVKDEVNGVPSEWFRTTPYETIYGDAPENLRIRESTILNNRREVWLAWDEVDGSTEYELQRRVFNPAAGGSALTPSIVVTDASFFHTGFTRAEFRVRGRKQAVDLCGAGANDRCHTGWTGWYGVGFTAPINVPAPPAIQATPVPDAAAIETREGLIGVVDLAFEPTGFMNVDGGPVVDVLVLTVSAVLNTIVFAVARRRGLGELGTGMALTGYVLCLWLGHLAVRTPVEWAIAASVVLVVAGSLATFKVFGLSRGA